MRIALWDCCILMLSCRLTYEIFVGNLYGYCSNTLKKCDSKKHTIASKSKEEALYVATLNIPLFDSKIKVHCSFLYPG